MTNGWEWGTIWKWWSGTPLDITMNGQAGNFVGVIRPDRVAGVPAYMKHGGGNPQNWLNPLAFPEPQPGTVGDIGRNAFTGPGINNFDMSLFKNFAFREHMNLQLRFEVYMDSKADPAAMYLLGNAYTRTGQEQAGKDLFAKMLGSQDTKAQADYLLGKAYYDTDRFEEAEQAFKEVLTASPNYPGTHRELGKVYLSLRRNPEAEEQLKEALKGDPDDSSAIYFLGGLYVLIGEYQKSLPYLERAHKMTPEFWATLYYLGKGKMKLGDTSGAVTDLQQAAKLNSDEDSLFYLLSKGLRALGREKEAKQAMQRVTEIHAQTLAVQKKALVDKRIVGTQ